MSQYKPYLKYKDSGIEWIGQVPEHWEVKPFKYILSAPMSYGANESAESDDPNHPRYIRITDLTENGTLREDTFKTLPWDKAYSYLLSDGDILLARSGATVGKSFLYRETNGAACFAGYLIKASCDEEKALPKYIYAYLQSHSYWEYISGSNIQSTIQNVSAEKYSSMVLPVPQREEQATIAATLDRETARIDGLIEKKTRFIELLKEKRQALITHAVTKGLDPNVPMKDSGIEWIGQVPEHWEVVQSRRLFSERKERARDDDKQYTSSQKYGVILQTEFMEREGRRIVLVEKGQEILKHIESGDFLISMRSFQGGIEECTSSGCVSSAYVPLRPIKWIWHSFFKYLFKSNTYIQALQRTSDLIRDGQALRFENFSKVPLLHVPISEQKDIALFLDNETARIDALISKSEQSITLLKERRAAFITAAVTGQIDLRGEH